MTPSQIRLQQAIARLADVPADEARREGMDVVQEFREALNRGEVRAADVPLFARAVGREDERTFSGSNQHTHAAHISVPSPNR